MPLGKRGPHNQRGEKGAPSTPLKRRYYTASDSSNVKMVADKHKRAAYHNKHW